MKRDNETAQLSLDLQTSVQPETLVMRPAQVIHFTDAATIKARHDAMRRVVASGIFSLRSNLPNL